MAHAELRRVDRRKAKSCWLNEHARVVTSQCGEDGLLAKIFEVIGAHNTWCVEFGAWDGKYLSNTWTLINESDWNAVLIEGDADKAGKLAAEHRRNPNVHVRNQFVGWEGGEALDNILASTPIPTDFDLLSIDIDGNDYWVWKALENYRPRVVVIEFNPSMPNDLFYVQDRDADVRQGSSLLAVIDLASSKGYELVATTPFNALFVLAEDFEKFGIDDNSIDAMYFCEQDIRIGQGFDGAVVAAGYMRLHWHDLELADDVFNVLPPEERRFIEPVQPNQD